MRLVPASRRVYNQSLMWFYNHVLKCVLLHSHAFGLLQQHERLIGGDDTGHKANKNVVSNAKSSTLVDET